MCKIFQGVKNENHLLIKKMVETFVVNFIVLHKVDL